MKLPKEIEQYLLDMIETFNDGNENLYPEGTEMQYLFESDCYDDAEFIGEEESQKFQAARKYLNQFEPIRITHNDIAYVFSIWDKDIKMEWIEPNWDEIN